MKEPIHEVNRRMTNALTKSRICYSCDHAPAVSGRMFCLACMPQRIPPIVQEHIAPPRPALWRRFLASFFPFGHVRALKVRIAALSRSVDSLEELNAGLRRMVKAKRQALDSLTQVYDECEAERSALSQKLTQTAIEWGEVVQAAQTHLGCTHPGAIAAQIAMLAIGQSIDEETEAAAIAHKAETAPLPQLETTYEYHARTARN